MNNLQFLGECCRTAASPNGSYGAHKEAAILKTAAF